MAYFQGCFPLKAVKKLNDNCFDFSIFCPDIVLHATSGQFVHIRCGNKTLRRPISICELDKYAGTVRLIFDVRGEGTSWLSQKCAGDQLDILGPLGNGFDFTDVNKKSLFIGGGIGTPPLLEAAKEFKGNADAILGFRNRESVILKHDFENICSNVLIATDNGSLGKKGFVTDLLSERLINYNYDVIYSCGPTVMLKAVSRIAAAHNIKCYVSLEERMGCGVGACLVCACQIKAKNKIDFKHVCKDGPVFDAEEVVW